MLMWSLKQVMGPFRCGRIPRQTGGRFKQVIKEGKNPSLKMWSHKPGGRIPRGRLSRFYCILIISKCKHSLNTCLTVRIDPAIVSLRLAVSFFEALFLFHSLVFFIISLKLFILIKYTRFYSSLIDYQSFLRELCDRVTGGIHRRWYGETI